ncbi:MAG: hypothetical protein K6A65_04635 [Succinivibrionaceae bacterium]|nr:hypothetical protein [Succinivibrionaceae bacterium]
MASKFNLGDLLVAPLSLFSSRRGVYCGKGMIMERGKRTCRLVSVDEFAAGHPERIRIKARRSAPACAA